MSGSPYLGLVCEPGRRAPRLTLGFDTAPTFRYLAAGETLIHLGAATVGASVGDDVARVGAFVSAGLVIAGAGVRAVVLPWSLPRARTGFELRVIALVPSAPAFEAVLAYAVRLGTR